jgi:hypothetical protein
VRLPQRTVKEVAEFVQLYESEMRNASIEVEVREEVAREMQETVQKMHVDFTQRFQDQASLVSWDLAPS